MGHADGRLIEVRLGWSVNRDLDSAMAGELPMGIAVCTVPMHGPYMRGLGQCSGPPRLSQPVLLPLPIHPPCSGPALIMRGP